MTRRRWHITDENGVLTLARRLPVRFDLGVRTRLPDAGRARVAHQIRQDIWRALRTLRGFSPAIEVTRIDGGLDVRAGGRVDGAFSRKTEEARLVQVLEDPDNRQRWIAWAR